MPKASRPRRKRKLRGEMDEQLFWHLERAAKRDRERRREAGEPAVRAPTRPGISAIMAQLGAWFCRLSDADRERVLREGLEVARRLDAVPWDPFYEEHPWPLGRDAESVFLPDAADPSVAMGWIAGGRGAAEVSRPPHRQGEQAHQPRRRRRKGDQMSSG